MLLGFGVPSYARTAPAKEPDPLLPRRPRRPPQRAPRRSRPARSCSWTCICATSATAINGEGTDQAPKLAGIGAKMKQDEIAAFLAKPSARALDAGMPNVDTRRIRGSASQGAHPAFVLSLKPCSRSE